MGSEDYDSTGKTRGLDSRTRSSALIVALAAGVCLGVMFSERLYVHYQVHVMKCATKALECLASRPRPYIDHCRGSRVSQTSTCTFARQLHVMRLCKVARQY